MNEIALEARRIIDELARRGLKVRLLGGLAVAQLCPSAGGAPFARVYSDIDLIADASSAALESGMVAAGCVPNKQFNLYHGHERLLFTSGTGHKVDLFVRTFFMSHRIDLAGRLPDAGYAADPADLLLTKLQIHEINAKDLGDSAALLLDARIDPARVAAVCAADWGLYRSVCDNLSAVVTWCAESIDQSDGRGAQQYAQITAATAAVRAAIEAAPKSQRWRLRALVGTRVRWYELPEEAIG